LFTYLIVFPLTHFVEYKDLVISPRVSVNSPIFGIRARILINSCCSAARFAAPLSITGTGEIKKLFALE
jgi:hypothetical protein